MGQRRVCFIVNPLAGIGGPAGLKGSDGVAEELLRLGYTPAAPDRARRFAEALARLRVEASFLTIGGAMGAEYLASAGLEAVRVYEPRRWPTKREDTLEAARRCLAWEADIVVFVGGDGTARDVASVVERRIPILGVPAGVKMYSSVFAESPEAAARVLADWLSSGQSLCEAEVMDIDEDAFRRGELRARLYAVVKTPCHRLMVGASKQPTPSSMEEEENKRAIARYIVENMEECTLYVLGPGSTVKTIADELGVEKTLLGVDVVHNGRLVARDVDEETLYRLVSEHIGRGGKVRIVVTPIGGQGFILGRGNQQISPRVVRKTGGKKALIVIATKWKMARLRKLRVDTGDPRLDRELAGYVRVVVDYGEELVAPVEAYTE